MPYCHSNDEYPSPARLQIENYRTWKAGTLR
jgi:hypothetical protein